MMLLPKLLLLISTFSQLLGILEARKCPKGQKVSKNNQNQCEACSNGYYQPEENESQSCQSCALCDGSSGSEIEQECTKETNTVCRCRGGFVPWDDDSSVCKCEIGFGLTGGECLKCGEGYFSTEENTPCSRWKDCKSAGVKTPGNSITDVICNDEPLGEFTHHPPIRNRSESTTKQSKPPHEGAQTPMTLMTIVTRASQQTTTEGSLSHFHHTDNGNPNGLIYIMLGISGILLLLTVIICRMDDMPGCLKKITRGKQKKDSACQKPVEESCHNSNTSLKLFPEEL